MDFGGIHMIELVTWLDQHPLPNWVTFGFTAVVWPLVLFWWNRRKVNSIAGLQVSFFHRGTTITIGGAPYPAVDVEFLNATQSVVYLTHALISGCTKEFPISPAASRDIANDAYELKFLDKNQYVLREITLHTNTSAKTCIPAAAAPPATFYQHKAGLFRRLLRRPKYFRIEYTALVGDKRYKASTVY